MICKKCGYHNKKAGICLCGFKMSEVVEKKPCVLKKKSEKQIDVKKKDIAYYKKCFEASNHICENCGTSLGEVWKPEFVAHIISKGTNTALRYDERNNIILCFACHFKFDHQDKTRMKIYPATELIRQELTLEYYQKK